MWACCDFTQINISFDGKPVAADFFDIIARDMAARSVDLRDRVAVSVCAFSITFEDGTTEERNGGVIELFERLHAARVDYAFFSDSVEAFAFIDYAIQTDTARKWERVESKRENMEKNGRYRKVTGNKYEELSGENGQRYVYKIWIKSCDSSRRMVTRGFELYGINNFFRDSFEKVASTYGIERRGRQKTAVLRDILNRFGELCRDRLNVEFLGKKKPVFMTCGSAAKYALLSTYYNTRESNAAALSRRYKNDHKLSAEQYYFLYDRKLNRGGICWLNESARGVPIETPLYKYDRNSSYSAVGLYMPDIVGIDRCEPLEALTAHGDGVYIVVVAAADFIARDDMPAVFFDPWTGGNPRHVRIAKETAFFAEELDELSNFYEIENIEISLSLRCTIKRVDGYAAFSRAAFDGKALAKAEKKGAEADFFKLLGNAAWGKLAQRGDFPTIVHKLQQSSGYIEQVVERLPAGGQALSLIQGAYVTMRGRVDLLKTARRVCAGTNMRETFIYCDTDSIHTTIQCPEIVGAGLGEWKLEHGKPARLSLYNDRKAYFNIFSPFGAPLEVEYHARGIPAAAIAEKLLNDFGADSLEELLDEAFLSAFGQAYFRFTLPFLANVRGGRLTLYAEKSINESVYSSTPDGEKQVFYGSRVVEI